MDDPGCAIAEPPRMSSVNSQSILVLSSIGRASKVFLKGKGKRNEDQGNFRKILNEWIKARTLRDPTYQGPFEAAAKTGIGLVQKDMAPTKLKLAWGKMRFMKLRAAIVCIQPSKPES